MSNKNLVTYGAKVSQVEQAYYAPISVIENSTQLVGTLYCFLSQVDPWPDENNPTAPTQDQAYIKNVFNNMFVAKQINSSDISPVTQRIDWTAGTVYDYYQDTIDMFQVGPDGLFVLHFYVKNRYDQVFKCLWNNNGGPSQYEPYFQPGNYGTNNIFQGAGDGYKWKYMYTIDTGSKQKFLDNDWMPIPVGQNTPNPVQTNAGFGDIEVINVISPGSGYDTANSVVTVNITGNGTTAAAHPIIVNGSVTDVVVDNPGTNYSYASASIVSSNTALGSGAVLVAPTSPIGGHGFDPISELGCNRVMLICQFSGGETINGIDYVPTDIDYRQAGIVVNPLAYVTNGNTTTIQTASEPIYKIATELTVSGGFGQFTSDEIIYQGSSLNNATFVGTVLDHNLTTNVVKVINIQGSFTINAPIYGVSSGTIRTLFSYVQSPQGFIPFSGNIAIIDNRTGVQRSSDGIEIFKFVLGY
jgi:hypothetical protein